MLYEYHRHLIFIYVIFFTSTTLTSLTYDVSDVALHLIDYHSGIEINAMCIVYDSGVIHAKKDTLRQKMYQKIFGNLEKGFVGSIDLHRHKSFNESQEILEKS